MKRTAKPISRPQPSGCVIGVSAMTGAHVYEPADDSRVLSIACASPFYTAAAPTALRALSASRSGLLPDPGPPSRLGHIAGGIPAARPPTLRGFIRTAICDPAAPAAGSARHMAPCVGRRLGTCLHRLCRPSPRGRPPAPRDACPGRPVAAIARWLPIIRLCDHPTPHLPPSHASPAACKPAISTPSLSANSIPRF